MKVSVIIPVISRYEKLSAQAIASVRAQLDCKVEPIVVQADGLTVGRATNIGVAKARGEYVMRLDADDWLNPVCCMVMSRYLDRSPKAAAVYSDYWTTDEEGVPTGVQVQERIPHPACMLIRRSFFEGVGGFDESLPHQDGTDFWLRLTKERKAGHLSVPLWYYRQHDNQMSRAHNRKVQVGQAIKEKHMDSPRILCVIPARGGSKGVPRKNLVRLDGVPLVARAIRLAKSCRHDMLIVVSTEDDEIADVAQAEGVDVLERPAALAEDEVSLIPVARHAMLEMEDWRADIVVTLPPTSPLLKPEHIDAALDIAESPEVDSVVAVSEVHRHPYRTYRLLSNARLEPYFPEESERYLQRQDRPPAYGFSGLYVRKRALLENWNGRDFALGRCYGVVVERESGVDIDSPIDVLMAQAILSQEG